MMEKKIIVNYFASFREQTGISEEVIYIDVDNAEQLFDQLKFRHKLMEPIENCKVAINGELAGWNTLICSGDKVLLFPPVAGG